MQRVCETETDRQRKIEYRWVLSFKPESTFCYLWSLGCCILADSCWNMYGIGELFDWEF